MPASVGFVKHPPLLEMRFPAKSQAKRTDTKSNFGSRGVCYATATVRTILGIDWRIDKPSPRHLPGVLGGPGCHTLQRNGFVLYGPAKRRRQSVTQHANATIKPTPAQALGMQRLDALERKPRQPAGPDSRGHSASSACSDDTHRRTWSPSSVRIK